MTKISKKLTSVIHIKDDNKMIEMFIKEVKGKGVGIISVKCPKEMNDISSSFVDTNWKISRMALKNKVIYAKPKTNEAYFIFADKSIERFLLRTARGFKLDAEYKYYVENKENSSIATKTIKNGVMQSEVKYSKPFKDVKYSVVRCIAN